MICVIDFTAVFDNVNVEMQSSKSCMKCLDLDAELLNKQNAYNDLSKSYSQLEKHCISLELTMQLNQGIFQKNSLSNNQNAIEIPEYFKNNDLKALLQAKDITICKLKEHIKSMRDNDKEEKVKHEMDDIETINNELEHIAQLNSKSLENADLKAQFQEKVFGTTALQSELKRLKGKYVLDNVTTMTNATTIAPGMFKLDIEPLSHRLKNNRDTHDDYLKNTIENINTICGLVERTRKQNPSKPFLDFACKFTKHVHELLVYVSQTCPSFKKPSEKLVVVTPMNKVNKVRFSEPLTSSSNIKQVESSITSDSNTPMLSSTGLKCFTSTCKSQPTCNKRNDRISQTPSSNMKNKVKVLRETQKPKNKVYSRIPKQVKSVGSSKKAKSVESKTANNSEPTHLWGSNATDVPSSSLVNDRLSRLFFGLGHNLFFVGQFCDANLEVAFRKNTCFVRNLEGVDLLSGSRDTNWYTISLNDMLKTSSIYLLSKASKTKSWLWHRRLSHLNFDTLNKLSKDSLARGILKLKFKKDHLCSACALGKSKKSSHQPKAKDTNQEKLYLLHIDLCGPLHVASINGKRYILVIVDDYSKFTWVKFLRTKDEAPEAIIKCIKNIQVRLNASVRNV
ncbi:retrovirus-related pol polyprotein from transposon TNT 1-94 [Tanacetum coccineum]